MHTSFGSITPTSSAPSLDVNLFATAHPPAPVHLNIKMNKLRKKNCFAILYIKCICLFLYVYIYVNASPWGKLQQTCGKIDVALLIMGYP
jgi:hypothetical protein